MLRCLPLLLCVLVFMGCEASRQTGTKPARGDPAGVRPPVLVRGDSGAIASWPEIVAACGRADVVLIGENHGHAVGLAFAADLFDALVADAPGACLSMEFFERDTQAAIDDYLAGLIDDATFRRRTFRTEGNYPPGHQRMVETAKQHQRPIIAANAPRVYVRLARTAGYERLDSLTPLQQSLFRLPDDMPAGRYREEFERVMSGMAGHGPAVGTPEHAEMIESIYRSQTLWDSTMADSIARVLREGHRPVVHVVGRFHIDHEGGLTQLLRQAVPAAHIVSVTTVPTWSSVLLEEDRGRADFVVYVGPMVP